MPSRFHRVRIPKNTEVRIAEGTHEGERGYTTEPVYSSIQVVGVRLAAYAAVKIVRVRAYLLEPCEDDDGGGYSGNVYS